MCFFYPSCPGPTTIFPLSFHPIFPKVLWGSESAFTPFHFFIGSIFSPGWNMHIGSSCCDLGRDGNNLDYSLVASVCCDLPLCSWDTSCICVFVLVYFIGVFEFVYFLDRLLRWAWPWHLPHKQPFLYFSQSIPIQAFLNFHIRKVSFHAAFL